MQSGAKQGKDAIAALAKSLEKLGEGEMASVRSTKGLTEGQWAALGVKELPVSPGSVSVGWTDRFHNNQQRLTDIYHTPGNQRPVSPF